MRYLSYQIIFFLLALNVFAQSPHGDKFEIDCSVCHNADSWKVELTQITFDHSKTNFPLIGQHQNLDCKSCHQSLVFSKMDKDCFSCHKDIHQATVGVDCASCHTPVTWIVKDIVGLHQRGRFPLLGAHKTADCAQCHSGYSQLNFVPLNIDCYACHERNYKSTQNPNHVDANFSIDCQDCHNINAFSWRTTNVDHSFFPLVGGHALPSCFSCHQQGGNFSGLAPDCYSCHQQNYEATQNPNHVTAGLPTTCNVCHNIYGWTPASFNHDITQFPLTGKHINVDCSNCHTNGYTGTPTDCYACHRQDYESVTDPNHVTSQFSTDCSSCHTTSGWEGATFDHNLSEFPLTGAHQTVDCAQCHSTGYTGTPTDCYACHQTNYTNTTNPNHQTVGIPTTCAVCHSTTAWQPAAFDHNITEFPLTGAHQTVDCAQCHSTGYTGTPTDCYACHQTDYTNTTNPNHQTAGIPTTCAVCHSTTAWQPAAFDHNITEFPLTGAHLTVDCAQCHTSGYTGTPTDCYACHQTDYTNTTNPNHQTAGIPTTCAVCHSTTAWQPAAFDHNITEFPLTGAHLTVDCAQCHTSGYTGTPTDCYACHQTDYTNTTNPNHQTAGIPTTCAVCHSTTAWQPATFDHNLTEFPLTGAHLTVDCAQCHSTGYTGTPTDCYACHQTNYTNTTNPNHQTAGIPTTCAVCHSTTAWQPATFDHNLTEFPLTGAHQTVDCAQCHSTGYTGTPTDCYACHQTDYTNTTNPNHQTAGIPTTCAVCHSTTAWQPAAFDHNITEFPLTGAHLTVDCAQCHTSGYTGTPTDCYACHQTDYTNTTNPNHQTAGIPTTCAVCHSTTAWQPAAFDHNITEFPLTGAHLTVDCAQCHTSGYTGTPTDCYACHQTDYTNTTNPNHQTAGIPTTCAVCHSTTAWQPAAFDHNITEFPLTGAHLTVDCAQCHTSGYTGTPTDCYACHQTDYTNTTNPNHQTAGIPTTCAVCHSTTAWQPATFDHNFFPIGSNHNNVDCNECHSEPNYQPQCLSCHLDDFNNGHNTGDPTNCWACHSTTNWDSDFNHSNTNFPLTGAHQTATCEQCHQSGYVGTPTDCYACHQTDYQQSANPSHTSLALSTTCQTCHTTNAGWAPATFPDHNNYFQLVGAHMQINNCSDCHQGNYNNTPNTCIGCHQNDYNGTTDPPHQTLNFSDNCLTCHTMNGWTPATFDHNFYPIGNNHNNVDCNECHSEPNYQPQCLSCHLDDFNNGHNTGDPTNCWACHSTTNWDSDFNHSNTNFPLTGAHQTATCEQCHQSGYVGTPTDCYACHQTDYQQSANPSHTSLALSTTCQTCHTTNAGWAPATFPDHNNYFQLVGAHMQINNCSDCHQGNYNNTPNTCIGCHQNDYNGTTDPPHQTLNFSDNCLTCHTMNGWTPATFDHNFYPIGNNHNNVDCNECHSEPNYQPQCLSCHLDDFNDEHNSGDPTDCWNCHGSSDWDAGGFDHNNTIFPLTGAHKFADCAQCHKEDKEGIATECFDCHIQDYLKSINPDHKANGISTDCVSCHSTNNWNSRIKMFEKNEVE